MYVCKLWFEMFKGMEGYIQHCSHWLLLRMWMD